MGVSIVVFCLNVTHKWLSYPHRIVLFCFKHAMQMSYIQFHIYLCENVKKKKKRGIKLGNELATYPANWLGKG